LRRRRIECFDVGDNRIKVFRRFRRPYHSPQINRLVSASVGACRCPMT
jgi:hypothetical protein